MNKRQHISRLLFALRFLLVGAVGLALLGLLLKPYAYLLGHVIRGGLNWLAGSGITGSKVSGNWYRVGLTFECAGRWLPAIPAGLIAINMAAFLALVGATPGIGLRRACRAACVGLGLFVLWHVFQLSVSLMKAVQLIETGSFQEFAKDPTGFVRLIGTASYALPFVLWLVLARPPFIVEFFAGTQRDSDDQQA